MCKDGEHLKAQQTSSSINMMQLQDVIALKINITPACPLTLCNELLSCWCTLISFFFQNQRFCLQGGQQTSLLTKINMGKATLQNNYCQKKNTHNICKVPSLLVNVYFLNLGQSYHRVRGGVHPGQVTYSFIKLVYCVTVHSSCLYNIEFHIYMSRLWRWITRLKVTFMRTVSVRNNVTLHSGHNNMLRHVVRATLFII